MGIYAYVLLVFEGQRKNPGKLSTIEFSRKLVVKFQGGVLVGTFESTCRV